MTPTPAASATRVRPARDADAAALPAVERSAAQAFRAIPGLAWLADAPPLSVARHRELIRLGAVWVAQDATAPVGFLCAEPSEDGFHIVELSVARPHQSRGLGRALVHALTARAAAQDASAVTLLTFRAVSWNAPFYERLGFAILGETDLTPALRRRQAEEAAAGLAPDTRCAMRWEPKRAPSRS